MIILAMYRIEAANIKTNPIRSRMTHPVKPRFAYARNLDCNVEGIQLVGPAPFSGRSAITR